MAVGWKRLAWALVAIGLLVALAAAGLPWWLRSELPARVSQALGRPVTLGDVHFNPFKLTLALDELVIGGAAGQAEPLLSIRQIRATVSPSSIVHGAPVISALEVDAPVLRVARTAAGRYDVDDLITRLTPAPAAASSEPVRFALYNLQLHDGQVRFDDRPLARVHQLQALNLAVPFLSNLPAEIHVEVVPRLAFVLDGAAFDSGAQALPFAPDRPGTVHLNWKGLDLGAFAGYLPPTLPVRLAHGKLSGDLTVQFASPPGAAPRLTVKGSVDADDWALTDARGRALAGWERLQLGLLEVAPFARKLAFDTLRVRALQLDVRRDATGQIDLPGLADGPVAPVAAPVPASASASAPATAAQAPWQVGLAALNLDQARVRWNDAAVAPAIAWQLDDVDVSVRDVQWPMTHPVNASAKGVLRRQGEPTASLASWSVQGPVGPSQALLDLQVQDLALASFAAYVAPYWGASVQGNLAVQARVDWAAGPDTPRQKLTIKTASVQGLAMREAGSHNDGDALGWKQLAVSDVQLDALARRVEVGGVHLSDPVVRLVRESDGRLNLQRWSAGAAAPGPAAHRPAVAPRPSAHGAAAPSWAVHLGEVALDGGVVKFSDLSVRPPAAQPPVQLALADLRLRLSALDWNDGHDTPAGMFQLSARVGDSVRPGARLPGTIDYKGSVGLKPLQAQGRLHLARFPVHPFAGYVKALAKLALLHAEASYDGSVRLHQAPAGVDLRLAGDALVGSLHLAASPQAAASAPVAATDELVAWHALTLKGLTVALTPSATPKVAIADATLSDFYSRLVITEQGRFNLRDVTDDTPPAPPAVDQAASAAASAAAVATAASAADAAASAPDAAASAPLPLDIAVGATHLVNGHVSFTDHFIRPNYSAELTELNGQLGAISSASRDMATLQLTGRAAGTALLEISGQLNPTVRPLALDIQARATDLELAPLSPYTDKYAGYAIERGKLSMDVAYKVDPQGMLEASNHVVLNQLTFGEKVESKDAINLPVRLAVALLKDRNGVIDVNLPISGSINDPKFSIGGLIFRVIVNLLVKAVTAPFSLLSGLGGAGGGADHSVVQFLPGTATIAPESHAVVERVAHALSDRPSLKMTVTGAADSASEHDALQAALLEDRLIALKRRQAPAAAAAPASAAGAALRIEPGERAALLKVLYERADWPDKPRNVLGLAKSLPADEMQSRLKAHIAVNDDAVRNLALQRGLAVREALMAQGLPSDRLFLAEPRLRAGAPAASEPAGSWTPRVELSLSVD